MHSAICSFNFQNLISEALRLSLKPLAFSLSMDSETSNKHPPSTNEVNPPPGLAVELPPPPQQQPRFSLDWAGEELLKEQRVPFPFSKPIRQRREDTWVISLLVMLLLVVFVATMAVNNCGRKSHGQCALTRLGRFSFQPLSENPFLGPSASALDNMGALKQTLLTEHHQYWRLFTSPWLHAGVFHLILNLSSIIFVGIHLEQEFGSARIGIIYLISAITGSLVAALFLSDRPSVTSSAALFGLLGTTLSGLIWNWKIYTKKFTALVAFLLILTINLILGLAPYVNNFSNVGGFLSGFLLGFVLLHKPLTGKAAQNRGGLFDDYGVKHAVRTRQKLDKPLMRSTFLIILSLLLSGLAVAVIHGTNANKYCTWCQYIDCSPSNLWSCSVKEMHCETLVSSELLTLTCSSNGKFRIFPFISASQSRLEDLCYLICS